MSCNCKAGLRKLRQELAKKEMDLAGLRIAMVNHPFGFCTVCRWNPCRCNSK